MIYCAFFPHKANFVYPSLDTLGCCATICAVVLRISIITQACIAVIKRHHSHSEEFFFAKILCLIPAAKKRGRYSFCRVLTSSWFPLAGSCKLWRVSFGRGRRGTISTLCKMFMYNYCLLFCVLEYKILRLVKCFNFYYRKIGLESASQNTLAILWS